MGQRKEPRNEIRFIMGLKDMIKQDMNPIWSDVLKRHKIKSIFANLVYEHTIHPSKRNTRDVYENIKRIRRSLNGQFLYSFNLTRALEEHPEITKQTWLDINLQINERTNALN